MMIGRQRAYQLLLGHDYERQAVGEAPRFVRALAEQCDRLTERVAGYRDHSASCIATVKLVPQASCDRSMPRLGKRGGNLQQNRIRCPELAASCDYAGELLGPWMKLVPPIESRDHVAGVQEQTVDRLIHRIVLASRKDNGHVRPPSHLAHRPIQPRPLSGQTRRTDQCLQLAAWSPRQPSLATARFPATIPARPEEDVFHRNEH